MRAWKSGGAGALAPGSNVRLWALRSSWTVADQALYALANFAVNILLARWLEPAAYGLFTVAYSVFLLLGTAHSGLLAEPMLALAPRRFAGDRPGYLGALLIGHAAFALIFLLIMIALGGAAWLVAAGLLAKCFVALGLVGPLVLLFWLFRRAALAYLQPSLAALASAAYLVLALIGLYVLYRIDALGPVGAILLMGAASAAASLWLGLKLGPGGTTRILTGEVMIEHWRYGRWSVATGLLTWVPAYIYYLVLPASGGSAASADLRALANLAMPALQMASSLGLMLVPAFAGDGDSASPHRLTRLMLALFALGGIAYGLLVGVFHGPLVALLYGGRYDQLGGLAWWAGFLAVPAGVSAVATAALRAMRRPDQVFRAYLISTTFVCLIGVPSAYVWGVAGAIVSMVAASACLAVTLVFELNRYRP